MVLIESKPSVNTPTLSKLEKPRGPSINSRFSCKPISWTLSSKALLTSRSEIDICKNCSEGTEVFA